MTGNARTILGEIRLFGGVTPPAGWRICDGSVLPSAGYEALSELLGNRFGGDATSFNLPDLRGRLPVHVGSGQATAIGAHGGTVDVTLKSDTMPSHYHTMHVSSSAATVIAPTTDGTAVLAGSSLKFYAAESAAGNMVNMSEEMLEPAGGGMAHRNIMPIQAVSYIICVTESDPPGYSLPFTGEIRMLTQATLSTKWALCNGQEYQSAYPKLTPVLGTNFGHGGEGSSGYLLPNLQCRAPIGAGEGPEFSAPIGVLDGTAGVGLSVDQLPVHTHSVQATLPNANPQTVAAVDGSSLVSRHPLGQLPQPRIPYAFTDGTADRSLAFESVSVSGGSAGTLHENRQPFLALYFYIRVDGVDPAPVAT